MTTLLLIVFAASAYFAIKFIINQKKDHIKAKRLAEIDKQIERAETYKELVELTHEYNRVKYDQAPQD
jgi:hypothetical protein